MADPSEEFSKDIGADEENVYKTAVGHLANGFVNTLESPLKDVKKQLKELEKTQENILGKLCNENLILSEPQNSQQLQDMFAKMKIYHTKLQLLKKDIRGLHDKSTKLKKRAKRLQLLKEKEVVEEIIINSPGKSTQSTQ